VSDDRPFELPEIVPATVDPPSPPASPMLPPRQQVRAGLGGVPAAARAAPQVPPRQVMHPVTVNQLASANPTSAPAASWGDQVPVVASKPGQALRAPGRRPRVRRVTRVVRHVDPWSVFKVALVFSFVGYLVALTSGVLLWRVADSTGTLDNIERWFTQFGWETFELKGGEIFANAWVIGLFVAVGATGAAVLAATLFNLVSDIVGGVRVTVLEEEVVERTASSNRRYIVRRPPVAGGDVTGTAPAWSVDDDEPLPTTTRLTSDPESAARTPAASADWSVDD
jgi:Transmembrane domain of unknown function (DUF3566)